MKKRTVTSFFDKEYLEYAKYVVENRAIPSCIDGLKPTQRKVVFVANKIWKNGNRGAKTVNVTYLSLCTAI